jgi:hypothetical protein
LSGETAENEVHGTTPQQICLTGELGKIGGFRRIFADFGWTDFRRASKKQD